MTVWGILCTLHGKIRAPKSSCCRLPAHMLLRGDAYDFSSDRHADPASVRGTLLYLCPAGLFSASSYPQYASSLRRQAGGGDLSLPCPDRGFGGDTGGGKHRWRGLRPVHGGRGGGVLDAGQRPAGYGVEVRRDHPGSPSPPLAPRRELYGRRALLRGGRAEGSGTAPLGETAGGGLCSALSGQRRHHGEPFAGQRRGGGYGGGFLGAAPPHGGRGGGAGGGDGAGRRQAHILPHRKAGALHDGGLSCGLYCGFVSAP